MDHDLPDREEIACALEVMESRLARQGQYDQAVDVFTASKLLRLGDDEITRLRAENARLTAECDETQSRINEIRDDCERRLDMRSKTIDVLIAERDGARARAEKAEAECEAWKNESMLMAAHQGIDNYQRLLDERAALLTRVERAEAECEALRADVVWAVRGYIRPIDDGQRLAIGIDPQTLFTRMVEWDGTDADILRAVREARNAR